MPETRPLEIVQQLITDHTSRRPAEADVIFDAMVSAIVLQGEAGLDFAKNLVSSLDEQDDQRQPFTTKPARIARDIGEAAFDITLDRHTRMGCLATIAAMSLVYEPLDISPLRTAGSVGHETLRYMHDLAPTEDQGLLEFISALAKQPSIEPATLACDLAALPTEVETRLNEEPTEDAFVVIQKYGPGEQQEILGDEERMPMQGTIPNRDAQKILWLDKPLNEKTELHVRRIVHDGQVKGYLADLTRYNPTLTRLMQGLERHEVYDQFLTRLSITLIRYFNNPSSVKRIPTTFEVVPTYYSGNPSSNENITRGYFTHLGKAADGKPLLGLLAAARTKKGELQVLGIITVRPRRGMKQGQIEGDRHR